MIDTEGNIKSNAALFAKSPAGEQKLLKKLLKNSLKTVTSNRLAESRRTAAETGKVEFEKPVNENVTNNKKRLIHVKFVEHVGGTKMLTDKSVLVILAGVQTLAGLLP